MFGNIKKININLNCWIDQIKLKKTFHRNNKTLLKIAFHVRVLKFVNKPQKKNFCIFPTESSIAIL